MFPILFKVPLFGLFGHESFPIYSYGVMMAVGFLVASSFVAKAAKQSGEDPAKALDLVFYILIAAILGSRLAHGLVADRESFFSDPLYLIKIWQGGGLVFYGGFLASVLVAIWYLKKHNLPGWKYFDIFAPGIALGHAIGRIGCFLVGCCHGRPLLHKTWYAVVFPPDSIAPAGIPLYPTQLMEAAVEFVNFLLLAFLLKRKKFDGQVIAVYVMFYSFFRFFIEFLRGDTVRGIWFDGLLSTSQLIALFLFLTGTAIYLLRRRTQKGVA